MSALRLGKSINDIVDSVLTKNPQCKRKEGTLDDYENCMANVKQTTNISELNQKLKAKKDRLGEAFTKIENDIEYC